jgi:hypothetical protein
MPFALRHETMRPDLHIVRGEYPMKPGLVKR